MASDFVFATTLLSIGLIYLAEKFNTGMYMGPAFLFVGLLALNIGEPMFYVATGMLFIILSYRMFWARSGDPTVEDDEDNDEDF